jgi:hypothetical protein
VTETTNFTVLMRTWLILASLAALAAPGLAHGQSRSPTIEGTWRTDTPDGPQTIIIRPDSSASFGDETVRWRLVGDSIWIALGGEWEVYHIELEGRRLTISGGDLEEPIMLERTGEHTPRPSGVEVPPAPPANRRAHALP